MTGSALAVLLLGLLLGLAAGAAVGVLVSRTELARRRSETAQAQAVTEAVRAESERFRADAAEARTETTAGVAVVAEYRARLSAMTAERDAARERAVEIAADRESLITQFKALSGETAERQGRAIDTVTAQRLQATEQLLTPVREGLELMNRRLTQVEKDRVEMATDLRAQVRSVRDTGDTLRRETQALVTALRKPQVRGSWGETQLKRVAELAGLVDRCDFDVQASVQVDGATLRPDMRVNLAEGKHVFVDSKVPLSAFLEAAECDDDATREAHLERFARHVRTHVDQLSAKRYWQAADSPEFVVLFLPNEAFFATALDQMPDLYEYAIARNIVLATPTVLIGMLRAVAYGWRQAGLAETAQEVSDLGQELYDRLVTLGSRFDKLGRMLTGTVKAYNETVASVEGRVLVSARKFRDLKVSEKELTPITGLDDAVRQIQAPELVEDAAGVEPMVGRGARGRGGASALPESEALFRTDPDLGELAAGELAGRAGGGQDGDVRRRDTGS